MSSGSGNQRSRNACISCTKRKVKCSKTIPCSNCLRRGEQDTCALEAATPEGLGSLLTGEERQDASFDATRDELGYLRKRVTELQTELQVAVGGLATPADRVSSSPILEQAPIQDDPISTTAVARKLSIASPEHPQQESGDAVVENAASILEFLAWGRRKNPDFCTVVSPEATIGHHAPTEASDIRDVPDGLDDTSDGTEILQMLLPSRRQVWQLVDYHQDCLLWYHNSYYAPTFRKQLEGFYDRFSGTIVDSHGLKPDINLQWIALLFSVLTASMTCAPPSTTLSWGFRQPEKQLLSKRWFCAVISSLTKADYTSNHSILSVQAISTLTVSAHLLGNSNMQAVHLAAAVRIAQGLGLHRLTGDAQGGVVEKETGRRVWLQLCSQDWFSTSFYEAYLINPLYSSTDPPLNCHDDSMVDLPESVPTVTSYCRFLVDVASIMPRLQDGLMECNTMYTKYDQVLKWDKRLRALATSGRPAFLSNAPLEPEWPVWIPWARRALAISSSHKIIMIHRSFLSESFVNPVFAFTRRTCLAASKTIVKEYKCVVEEDGPILWIHQAFPVAAAIILVLDVLHRDSAEPELAEHKSLVEDVVRMLLMFDNMIAQRGSKLLSALLSEVSRASQDGQNLIVVEPFSRSAHKRRRLDGDSSSRPSVRRPRGSFDVPAFVKGFCDGKTSTTRPGSPDGTGNENQANGGQQACFPSAHMLESPGAFDQDAFQFPPMGMEGATSFENLLYLANHDFSII